MSDTVTLAIIAGLFSLMTTIVSTVALWVKMQMDKEAALSKVEVLKEKVQEVHIIVNSQKTAMLDRIASLEGVIKALAGGPQTSIPNDPKMPDITMPDVPVTKADVKTDKPEISIKGVSSDLIIKEVSLELGTKGTDKKEKV